MPGLLLDTHALFWLVSGEDTLTNQALVEIGLAQTAGNLYVSPITAWELSVATQKPRQTGRPHLGRDPVDRWFREAIRATSAKIIPIHQTIALEAANVVLETGHKDPGDCYLIATARRRRIPIVTRDAVLQRISAADPHYLAIIAC
ncbi:type II toxin-antitoxin system VapC family toxin [Bradyrhizobium sp. STM 3557]|uniref:type II toxin-antitoxin system VapC family toxin n=1 Tax=Bradyrhizobium sp. STM 3557 TaxID=578920 RepID=UPI00388DF999